MIHVEGQRSDRFHNKINHKLFLYSLGDSDMKKLFFTQCYIKIKM